MDEKKVESIIFGLKETIAEQKAEIERLAKVEMDLIGKIADKSAEIEQLTREEYEKLKNGEVTYNQMVRIVAEKFAERVKMAFYYEFDELIPSIMADKIDEICKEIMEGKV